MRRYIKLYALFILLLVFATTAAAQSRPLVGKVVAISDGDTITVLDSSNTQHRIRLQGVDAPESKQDFGSRAKQNLSDLIFNKQVTVEWNGKDRYQRILGKVMLEGRDINLEQLKSGMAWYYKAYERDVAAADRKPYREAETDARLAKRGLWADANPIAPWDFRRNERDERKPSQTRTPTPDNPIVTAAPEAGQSSGQIVGNKNSKKYHLPGCPGYNQTAEKNRVYFKSAQEAEAAGYTKAGNCNN